MFEPLGRQLGKRKEADVRRERKRVSKIPLIYERLADVIYVVLLKVDRRATSVPRRRLPYSSEQSGSIGIFSERLEDEQSEQGSERAGNCGH